jgi:hypothetical protein|nr:MAG TPA: hypothetical protein [Caudoviricetes sp.]
MANNEFTKLYNETRAKRDELYNMPITKLKVWFVEENGLGNVGDVESCRDFTLITDRGSVVISGTLGPFLKVNDGFWIRTAPSVSKKLWSDLDLVNQLILEYEDNEYITTIIDPGL